MADLPLSRAAADQRRRFLTVAETADLLHLSTSTVHRAIRAGDFPAIKIRGRYAIPAKALDAMEAAALAVGLVDSADPAAYCEQPTHTALGAPRRAEGSP